VVVPSNFTGAPAEDELPRDDSVVLTYFHVSDAAALTVVDTDPEHRRRFEFPDGFVPSLEHSARVISGWARQREEGGPYVFAVRSLVDGKLVGGCEIRFLDQRTANLSYFTLPQHRRRGVASSAVRLVCGIAFATLGVSRLEIVVDPDNIASRSVAVRCGFRQNGRRNGQILYAKDNPILLS